MGFNYITFMFFQKIRLKFISFEQDFYQSIFYRVFGIKAVVFDYFKGNFGIYPNRTVSIKALPRNNFGIVLFDYEVLPKNSRKSKGFSTVKNCVFSCE